YLMPRELDQKTIFMAHRSSIRQEYSRDYFASRIGNSILGSGGFSSRILNRVRTELGLSYSAGSFWTTPDDNDGIVGALTRTKSESTIAATRAILEVMEEMRSSPPARGEVEAAVEAASNGFCFNFQGAMQVVSRRVLHDAQELPEDWLERYVAGVQRVSAADVHNVLRRHLDPGRMVILILGDPSRFDLPVETLGEVTVWEVEGVTDSVRPVGPPPG
ncbi:MAG: insulinase family protein, partial [Gammaproteobacteria bacterium]|nr:insulinase family protein [Gammaproteobacteria bacterium]